MSDFTPDTPTETSEAASVATDAEVTEAVEALVRSVEAEAKSARSATAAKPKARGTRSADRTVDNLVTTVNTLAGSVEQLAATVQTLATNATATPAPATMPQWIQTNAPVAESGETAEEVGEPAADVEQDVLAGDDVGAVVEPAPDQAEAALIPLVGHFASYVASFTAIGLVAAGMMTKHFGVGAIAMIAVGTVVFTVVETVRARTPETALVGLAKAAGFSAVTALGIAMFAGGATFFGHAPHRAAKLLPVGVALSAFAFVATYKKHVSREHMLWIAGGLVWICLIMSVVLGMLAGPAHKVVHPVIPPADAVPAASHGEAATTGNATTGEAAAHEAAAPSKDSHDAATTSAHAEAPTSSHESVATVPASVSEKIAEAQDAAEHAAAH